MNIKQKIAQLFSGVQEYIETEKELIKLKLVKEVAKQMGLVFSAIFIIMLFHICIALVGVWLGFVFADYYDSYTIGFGVTAGLYIIWFMVSIIFRKTLLIKPFTNAIISAMIDTGKADPKKDE